MVPRKGTTAAVFVRVLSRTWLLPRRRALQVALGLIWLLDSGLQYQPFMFHQVFVANVLKATVAGNPVVIKDPMNWSIRILDGHIAIYNVFFATIQLAIAVLILRRGTVKAGLLLSIPWAVGVWWFGEGLGGILTSPVASPFAGLPGAVILYAFIAVLVWPRDEDRNASVATSSPLGPAATNLLWTLLWTSFVYALLQPANRSPKSLGLLTVGMGAGEPGWLASLDKSLGSAITGNGTEISIVCALLCVLISVGILIPQLVRPTIVLAVLFALVIWAIENFGGILTTHGTDPSSGLLLVLLAVTYWPYQAAHRGNEVKSPDKPDLRPLG